MATRLPITTTDACNARCAISNETASDGLTG